MTIKKYCPNCGGDTKQDVNGIGMTICQVCKLDCTSDTPRTDNFIATDSFPMAGYDALCEFARDLEREITILKRRVSEYQPYADAAICTLPETTKTPRKDVTDCRGRAARDWLRGLVGQPAKNPTLAESGMENATEHRGSLAAIQVG